METTSLDSIRLQAPAGGETPAADHITINRIDLEAPWRWLGAGWSDIGRMPAISLGYGAVFTLLAVAMLFGLARVGGQALILPLAGGFLLIGPVLAAGLYEGSRRLETGEQPSAVDIVLAGFRMPGQLAQLGLILMLIFLAWVETAFLLLMLYSGAGAFPPFAELFPQMLYTNRGLLTLIVGTLEGAALAALVFAISAISAPMLTIRPVGIALGIYASVRAVGFNLRPMALWAALIALIMLLGIATFFLGLIVAFPLIGHATWHAYREITAESHADDETASA
jgi:uncharacterized membrane protein